MENPTASSKPAYRRILLKLSGEALMGTQPFGIVVYGYGAFTSYMYPGGLDLRKIAPSIIR